MSVNTNTLGKFTRTTVPVPRRARQIKGDFTDRVRYFRCRKCGFICDIKRDLRLDKDRAGIGVVMSPNYVYLTDALGQHLTDENGNWLYYVGSTGNMPVVKHGCPFCGSTRWKE